VKLKCLEEAIQSLALSLLLSCKALKSRCLLH
jgi:hypothetical protein